MNKMTAFLFLFALVACGCAEYKTRRALVADGAPGNVGSPVRFEIVNSDSTSSLVFENHSDFSRLYSAHGGLNIVVRWNCHIYKDKPNRYVRVTFGCNQYGWFLDSINESDGTCP
ncbi:MAG: hypothetical protein FVQ81_08075 [Candidatus Glassbacteria bacterium]|nr:hypothetical protein [Candidatus Glassbacteria bacterium]